MEYVMESIIDVLYIACIINLHLFCLFAILFFRLFKVKTAY